MRKIRIFEHTSLDGVIAPPGDSEFAQGGWSSPYRSPRLTRNCALGGDDDALFAQLNATFTDDSASSTLKQR